MSHLQSAGIELISICMSLRRKHGRFRVYLYDIPKVLYRDKICGKNHAAGGPISHCSGEVLRSTGGR